MIITNLYKFIFIILSIISIYIYVSIMKSTRNAEHKDILNIKLLELDVCGWNLLHICFNFLICCIFNINTIIGYSFVFLSGILWFSFEKVLFLKYNKNFSENNDDNKKYVYSSISYPRHDDIIYNFIGIIIHFMTNHQVVK